MYICVYTYIYTYTHTHRTPNQNPSRGGSSAHHGWPLPSHGAAQGENAHHTRISEALGLRFLASGLGLGLRGVGFWI